jgi:hypothetical protein
MFIYSNFFTDTNKYQIGERGPEKKIAPKAQKDRPQKNAV